MNNITISERLLLLFPRLCKLFDEQALVLFPSVSAPVLFPSQRIMTGTWYRVENGFG